MKGITPAPAVSGFGSSVRIFLADSQGFHRFMATDLEHEDTVETAIFGPENNLIVTGSRDALIQVRGRLRAATLTSASALDRMIPWGPLGFKIQKPTNTSAGRTGRSLGGYGGGVSWDPVADVGGSCQNIQQTR